MAEEALDGVQVRSRLQQVRSVGMAQRVNTALLADAGPELGEHVDLLGDGEMGRVPWRLGKTQCVGGTTCQ